MKLFGPSGEGKLPRNKGSLKQQIRAILEEHNHKKSGKDGHASNRTQALRAQRIFAAFDDLVSLGFKLKNPRNLKPKHPERLVESWVLSGLSAGTIQNNLTALRLFAEWINKKGLVKTLAEYAPHLKRTYAATQDRSPSQKKGIDFNGLLDDAFKIDKYVAMQLLLCQFFGARRKEAVMFQPLRRDKLTFIELVDGTKNGRPRTVPIVSDEQRFVLDRLKEFALTISTSHSTHIGNPNKSFKQNYDRFGYVMKKIGATKARLGDVRRNRLA